jgi:hypothetical protein
MHMEMMLLIAVRFVSRHVDYLVKVSMPIFGIFLTLADRTQHKYLTM